MRKQTIGAIVLGVAGFAFATSAFARDIAFNPGAPVKFDATVAAVREVPAGNPLPGLHIDAKVNGRATDIYLAPVDFAVRYGVKVAKGDYVRVTGITQPGDTETVLAKEITTGLYDQSHAIFRPTLTIYLRNDDGPLWVENTKPID